MRSETTGKARRSPGRLTEEEALARDPGAVRILNTCEVIRCPESVDEWPRWSSDAFAPRRGV